MPESNKEKIYGYDEELWYRVLRSQYWSGDRDVKEIDRLLRRLSPGKEILDLGCGTGRISNRLATTGYSVTGIDLSRRCIDEARKIAEGLGVSGSVTYIVGDYRDLVPISGKKFDAALCILAPAWKSTEEFASIFRNLAQHMNDNGILIVRETLKERFLASLYAAPSVQNWFRIDGDMLSLHTWDYDPLESKVKTKKEFYGRLGNNFEFITRIEQEYRLHSFSEYAEALGSAGWDLEEVVVDGVDILKPAIYNDPWWLYSALMAARVRRGGT
ncbi:MAG: class I SAM-dependent methyltransferase [Candidatus Verstraetearchaeota archaeon]|nr:class I SAM-dependent methyltransferase [Candidatus Verstraetearchaeota archaeon]